MRRQRGLVKNTPRVRGRVDIVLISEDGSAGREFFGDLARYKFPPRSASQLGKNKSRRDRGVGKLSTLKSAENMFEARVNAKQEYMSIAFKFMLHKLVH